MIKGKNKKEANYSLMKVAEAFCNIKSLITITSLYAMLIFLVRYLNISMYSIVKNPLSENLGFETLKNIILYTFLPLIILILVITIAMLARSLIIGVLALLSVVYYLGEESFFHTSTMRYTGLLIVIVVAVFLGLFLLIYVISQFLGGYLDSVLTAVKYRGNKFAATSMAFASLSIEIFAHTSLWPKDPLGSILIISSIILTVVGISLLNNSMISLVFAILSGLGWPVTFLTYLFISFQPAVFKKNQKGACLNDLRIIGVSNRVPASRNVLRSVAFRWTLRGVECVKPLMPCIPLQRKLIIHVYGTSAKKALLSMIKDLNFRIMCLNCDREFWKRVGEPLHVTPENIALIEERRPRVVFVESPEDYAYSVAVELSKTAKLDEEVVIVDGVESLFFNTRLLRATLRELINSFKTVILMSNYLDYYLLSNHVFRFSSTETLYIIGNARNEKVIRELLKDFLDSYVIDNIIERVDEGKNLLLFPIANKLLLLESYTD